MKSVPTIALDYRPSRLVAGAAAAIVLLTCVAPLLSGLPPTLRALLAASALFAGAASLARFLRPRLRRISHGASGWQLVGEDGPHEATLASHARIGSFIALSWRIASGGRRHAVLAPDNLDADTRRRLALLLMRADIVSDGADAAHPRD